MTDDIAPVTQGQDKRTSIIDKQCKNALRSAIQALRGELDALNDGQPDLALQLHNIAEAHMELLNRLRRVGDVNIDDVIPDED